MTRKERATANFKSGYNCAQAVVCAYSDMLNIDEKTLYKLASSFGGGLGRMREVCGTVSGIAMVVGLLYGYELGDAPEYKTKHYALIQELAGKFREENGSIICRELLAGVSSSTNPQPDARTPEYYKKRPCAELVGMAAEILENYISSHENNK